METDREADTDIRDSRIGKYKDKQGRGSRHRDRQTEARDSDRQRQTCRHTCVQRETDDVDLLGLTQLRPHTPSHSQDFFLDLQSASLSHRLVHFRLPR